jgi:predicted dehydrogenase
MRTVKVGMIGAGWVAHSHLSAIRLAEGIEVAAITSRTRLHATKTAQEFGIPHVCEDYHDLLKMDEVEAVIVCTPNQQHRLPTVEALKAGKHVLVEKPMAATLEDAIAMTRAAHETDKILMVGLKTRYSPYIQAARRIFESGELGEVYYAEAVMARRCGIPGFSDSFIRKDSAGLGAVADIGVYALDAALYVMGYPKPVAVSGIANNLLGTKYAKPVLGAWEWKPEELEVEDFGVASVRLENGTLLIFKTAWIMHMDSLGGTFFLGTKAGLRLEPLTIYRNEWGTLTDTQLQTPQVEDIELFKAENLAFADAIREDKPSPIPADEMLLTNVIIQGLIDSSAAGREILLQKTFLPDL